METSRPQKNRFVNLIGQEFVWVEPGTFMMGIAEGEMQYFPADQHRVTLTNGFWMQTTQVTQKQWVEVMQFNPSTFNKEQKAAAQEGHIIEGCENCPVDSVSWYAAQGFIQELQNRTGDRYRLPTEAEWEYACRAGTTTAFASGPLLVEEGVDDNLEKMGWYGYEHNPDMGIHPVALKSPNAWGLYDMHGNVYEWCSDWFEEYCSESVIDPVGPADGTHKVTRGGSWCEYVWHNRSSSRDYAMPMAESSTIGFRLVIDGK